MIIKENELKIFYKCNEGNDELEAELEKLLKKYGYHRWASGYDLEDGIRDIAFDKEE